MYFNDVNIIYYIIVAIIGLFVGEFVNWMNKRLSEEKKVFTLDFFKEYKKEFKPNYILMIITMILYIGILYRYGIHNTLTENLDLLKYLILTPMILSAFIIDYRLQIIPNRLNLTMFEIGLIFAFLYGISNVAISINMLLGMLARRRNFFNYHTTWWLSIWQRGNGAWRCETNGSTWTIFWTCKYHYRITSFIFNRSNFKYNTTYNQDKKD